MTCQLVSLDGNFSVSLLFLPSRNKTKIFMTETKSIIIIFFFFKQSHVWTGGWMAENRKHPTSAYIQVTDSCYHKFIPNNFFDCGEGFLEATPVRNFLKSSMLKLLVNFMFYSCFYLALVSRYYTKPFLLSFKILFFTLDSYSLQLFFLIL